MNVSVRAALQAREERAGRAREGRAARTADVPTEKSAYPRCWSAFFFLGKENEKVFKSI